jgi:MFS family permease
MSALASAYRPLFFTARARWLVMTSLIGRLSTGVYPIPLILLIQGTTRSFVLAGVAESVNLATAALTGPARGRALDKWGSRRAIPPMALARAAAVGAIWPVASSRSTWAVLLVAAVAGLAAPALPTAMRLQWRQLLGREDARLARAYAFESLAQVSLFVAGPLVAAAGIAALGPGATVAASGGLLLLGALPFAALAIEDRARPPAHRRARISPVRIAGVRTLVIATVIADAALGVIDLAVIAFAKHHGNPSAAGLLLAIFCLASIIGGAAYGARHWSSPPRLRLAGIVALSAALYLPLAIASSIAQLAGLLALAGAPFAAQWTTSYLALDEIAHAQTAGEAMSWISAANATGVGIGYAVAGAIIQNADAADAFLAAAALLALAALTILTRQGTLAARTAA